MAYCGQVKWFNKQYGFIKHQGPSYKRTTEAFTKLYQHLKDTNQWDAIEDDIKQEVEQVMNTDNTFPDEIFVHRTSIKLHSDSDLQILLPHEIVTYDINTDSDKPDGKQNAATNVTGAHKAFFNYPGAMYNRSFIPRDRAFVPVPNRRYSPHDEDTAQYQSPQDYVNQMASMQRVRQNRQRGQRQPRRKRQSRRQRTDKQEVETAEQE